MSRKPMFDKYDRPTIHNYLAQREEAIREAVEAAVEDAKTEQPQAEQPQAERLDFDGMPLNWEEREYEKMLDYKSFLAGDDAKGRF
jgi:hypothetical protein